MTTPIFTNSNWTFPLINEINLACQEIAVDELKLDCYPNQIEVITSEQMLDVYSCGLPVMYKHWSFGKSFVRESYNYHKGNSGLAYEVVFNSNPCIAYLMEENSMTMQALVIAHACYGHNSYFRNNYLFKQWTDASAILDYLVFARDYIAQCESRYGAEAVESILDSCHALKYYGVDKYRRPGKLSKELEEQQKKSKLDNERKEVNALWDHLIPKTSSPESDQEAMMEPQENILYFLEKNAPNLKQWQRELIRITRKIAQYFYPNYQTQTTNEGWASTVHYYIMTRLMEKGQITEGSYLEFLASHTAVVNQQPMSNKFNPYWLGFNMFSEIKRVCQEPTKEDAQYFPNLVGTDWLPAWHDAVANFRDESFISQYLTPNMVRKERMFMINDDSGEDQYKIGRIHDERGFHDIRSALSDRYKIGGLFPDIQIVDANLTGNRQLELVHTAYDGIRLENKSVSQTLHHLKNLWGYDVQLSSIDAKSNFVMSQYHSYT